MSIRSLVTIATVCAAMLAGPAHAQKAGGTLVIGVQSDPPTLGGYMVVFASVAVVTSKIYDGLLEYDLNLQPKPSLAKSWTISDDGKTLTFKLRDDVTFHDGKPFTSADAKYSIQEVLSKVHPRGINTFRELEDVVTPDDTTLILKLKRPAPYLMSALAGSETPMLPKHVLEGKDARASELASKPMGTGPFRFVEWKRGEYVRLDKNTKYWKKNEPYLDRIVIRPVPDSATRTAMIEKGEIHIAGAGAVPYSDAKRLAVVPSLKLTTDGNQFISNVVELTVNTRKKPFDDQKVRQAVAYGVDRKFIVDNIVFGFGKPSTGPIHSNQASRQFYTTEVLDYGVSDRVARANKLLDEAGYPRKADGTRFEVTHDINPFGEEWRRMGELFQQQMALLGIKVTLRLEDAAGWIRRLYTTGDFEISSNHLFNLSDPVIGVYRGLHSSNIKPGIPFSNGSHWSSPKTDTLMDQAAIEVDPAKRAGLYRELQAAVTEAEPNIYVFDLNYPTVYSARLQNVTTDPSGVYGSYSNFWLDK